MDRKAVKKSDTEVVLIAGMVIGAFVAFQLIDSFCQIQDGE